MKNGSRGRSRCFFLPLMLLTALVIFSSADVSLQGSPRAVRR
jgi:hypothetical protein